MLAESPNVYTPTSFPVLHHTSGNSGTSSPRANRAAAAGSSSSEFTSPSSTMITGSAEDKNSYLLAS